MLEVFDDEELLTAGAKHCTTFLGDDAKGEYFPMKPSSVENLSKNLTIMFPISS